MNYFVNGTSATHGGTEVYKLLSKKNPGDGSVCAQIYVFDPDQDMISCCSCLVTAAGETGALVSALTFNPTGGVAGTSIGAVKVVSTVPTSQCGAGQLGGGAGGGEELDTDAVVVPHGLWGAITHDYPGTPGGTSEVIFSDTHEPSVDEVSLASICGGVQGLGTGVCVCPNEAGGS